MVALNQTGKSALKNFLNKQQFIERTRGLHESKEANGPRLSFPSCLYIQEGQNGPIPQILEIFSKKTLFRK